MPRAKPEALGWVARDDEDEDMCAVSYLSSAGEFSKDGFKVSGEGIFASPAGMGKVSSVRLEDLRMLEVLGKGACSEVRKVVHVPSGVHIALKCFDVADQTRRVQLISELRALLGNRCPHLVSLCDAFYVDDKMYVALEYMDAGSLDNLIKIRPMPSEAVVAAVIKQVLAGLYFLHVEMKQIHRDLKPGNIVLNRSGVVKISDFGMTKQLNPEFGTAALATTFLGTVMYMSPERLKGEPYSYVADVWAVGIIAYELAHYRHPFSGNGSSYIELMQTVLERPLPEPDAHFSPPFRHFLQRCCDPSPRTRARVLELLEHPWCKGAPGPDMVAYWLTG